MHRAGSLPACLVCRTSGGEFRGRNSCFMTAFCCARHGVGSGRRGVRLLTGGARMRILGLDYGSVTVGVAVSDALRVTAQPLETITRKDENKLRQTCARIEQLIAEYEVESIVLGYPKNMNDSVGERAKKTEEFKAMLERRTGLPVTLWDERLTTVAAERVLMESGVRRENRKAVIDQVAAALILQGYLDSLS